MATGFIGGKSNKTHPISYISSNVYHYSSKNLLEMSSGQQLHKMKTAIFLLLAVFSFYGSLKAQTLYVDAQKGRDDARGTLDAPLASLQEAMALAGDFSGNDPE